MSDEEMGSLLDSSPPVVVEDVDEVPSSSVRIDIGNDADGDAGLEARMARLMTAHAEEQHRLELRVSQLEQLALASTVAEAARDCASAAKCASEILEATRAAAELLASAGVTT